MCRHHWVIELPAGPYSYGRCKFCFEQRYFTNAEGERVATKLCKVCRQSKPATQKYFQGYALSIRLRRTCRECEGVLV